MSEEKIVREIISDTETTGLSILDGNRVIEIGLIEVINDVKTGRELHYYINPEGKSSEQGALDTHKIQDDFLLDKPKFSDIADEVEDFVRDAKFVAHNARFDADFLDMEFKKAGKASFYDTIDGIIDTLTIAKQLVPGKKKKLDDLLKYYDIDASTRKDAHGAHIDATLLFEVYKIMKKSINVEIPDYESDIPRSEIKRIDLKGFKPALISLSTQDLELHNSVIDSMTDPIEKKSEQKVEVVEESKPAPAKKSFF